MVMVVGMCCNMEIVTCNGRGVGITVLCWHVHVRVCVLVSSCTLSVVSAIMCVYQHHSYSKTYYPVRRMPYVLRSMYCVVCVMIMYYVLYKMYYVLCIL